MGCETYEGVLDMLDPAPFPVGRLDLQGCNGLTVENRDRSRVWERRRMPEYFTPKCSGALLTGMPFQPYAVSLSLVFSGPWIATGTPEINMSRGDYRILFDETNCPRRIQVRAAREKQDKMVRTMGISHTIEGMQIDKRVLWKFHPDREHAGGSLVTSSILSAT